MQRAYQTGFVERAQLDPAATAAVRRRHESTVCANDGERDSRDRVTCQMVAEKAHIARGE